MKLQNLRACGFFRYTLLAVSAFHLTVCVSGRALSLQTCPEFTASQDFRSGIRNSACRPLTSKQRQALLEGLRQKTGLMEMQFDEYGVLQPGDRTRIEGGSPAARALILAAVDSPHSFRLENHENSPTVAFAKIESTEDYEDSAGIRHVVWEFRFDFRDFAELRGPAEAVAAFDPALQLMHELGHSVLGLHDPVNKDDELGDCERRVNLIRRELGLPLRQNYNAQSRMAMMPGSSVDSLKAEIFFVQSDDVTRSKTYALYFNVETVLGEVSARLGR